MNTREKWLEWAIELQSIVQAGIFYSKDKFDIQRFERIRAMAAEMISHKTDMAGVCAYAAPDEIQHSLKR